MLVELQNISLSLQMKKSSSSSSATFIWVSARKGFRLLMNLTSSSSMSLILHSLMKVTWSYMIGAWTSSCLQNKMFCVACTVCETSHSSCFQPHFKQVTKRSWDLRWSAMKANTGFVSLLGRKQCWGSSRKLILTGILIPKTSKLMVTWPVLSKGSTKINLCLYSTKIRAKS